jgi:hypothetical protein
MPATGPNSSGWIRTTDLTIMSRAPPYEGGPRRPQQGEKSLQGDRFARSPCFRGVSAGAHAGGPAVAPPVGSSDRSVRRSGRAPGGPVSGIIGELQAVAGSSPVAHPHSRSRSKGRISGSVLLRLGSGRATNELPILRWRGVGARLPGRVSASESGTPQDGLSAEQVAKAGAVAEAFGGGLGAWHRVIGPQNWARSAHRPSSDAVCEHAPAPAGDRGQPAGGNSSRSKPPHAEGHPAALARVEYPPLDH